MLLRAGMRISRGAAEGLAPACTSCPFAGADFFEAVVFFEAIAGLFFEDVAALFFAAAGLCFGATPFFDATAEPFFELLLVGWLAASFRRLFFLATDPEAFPGDFLDDFFVAMDAFPEGHPQNK
ncbi:MAG: hypothetical protein KDK23_10575 [Leptospiraceae bacterium]|nr:hypothetical protein [Leptospiraceae bacterium]